MYHDIPEDLKRRVEPIVESHGLELVDAELTRARPWRLRVVVDTASGDGRVPVDLCASVSREIGANLDASDVIDQRYLLEVTSPGLDRTLAREKDFMAACGEEVKIETRRPRDGRKRYRGLLKGYRDGLAELEVDGRSVELPFAEVAKANVVYQFSRADFARGRTSR